jgi:translation initiation factor 3 subunit L
MYLLLALAVALCPQRIDENVHNVLKEKHADKMARIQRGYGASFPLFLRISHQSSQRGHRGGGAVLCVPQVHLTRTAQLRRLFRKHAPGPNSRYDRYLCLVCVTAPQEVLKQQTKAILSELAQQVKENQLPAIRSYLKLYTTIPVAKLASFLDVHLSPFPFLKTKKKKTALFYVVLEEDRALYD